MSTMNQTGKQICNGQLKGDPKRTHDHPMFIRLLANDTSKLAMSVMSWDCYKEDPFHPLRSLMLHGYYEVGLLQGGPSSPSMNLYVACILLVAEGCHLPSSLPLANLHNSSSFCLQLLWSSLVTQPSPSFVLLWCPGRCCCDALLSQILVYPSQYCCLPCHPSPLLPTLWSNEHG